MKFLDLHRTFVLVVMQVSSIFSFLFLNGNKEPAIDLRRSGLYVNEPTQRYSESTIIVLAN